MIYKYNEDVSAKSLSDLASAICFAGKWKPIAVIRMLGDDEVI